MARVSPFDHDFIRRANEYLDREHPGLGFGAEREFEGWVFARHMLEDKAWVKTLSDFPMWWRSTGKRATKRV